MGDSHLDLSGCGGGEFCFPNHVSTIRLIRVKFLKAKYGIKTIASNVSNIHNLSTCSLSSNISTVGTYKTITSDKATNTSVTQSMCVALLVVVSSTFIV